MKKNWKKSMLIALAGAFMVTGIAAYNMPGHSAASPYKMAQSTEDSQGQFPGKQNKMFDASEYASQLAADFNVKAADVEKYLQDGWRPNDLRAAACISYIADKNLGDVLNAKTTTNDWRQVEEGFGITFDQHHQAMQGLHVKRMAEISGVSADSMNALLSEGYHMRDVSIAAMLAKQTDKDINSIISLKQVNNRWSDIAADLGVDKTTLQDLVRQCAPGRGMMGGYGHGMGMMGGGPGPMAYNGDCPNYGDNNGYHNNGRHNGNGRHC